ncbi:hypothetical protein J6590_067030 [Homalodisca vitripennis]|nr:hypothetical protein J6590_067030 [Homalodisca vitripennis]
MLVLISRELVCILSLSLSFMFLFSSDMTMINMQDSVGEPVYLLMFNEKQYIDQTTRRTVLYFLVGINILAVASPWLSLNLPVTTKKVHSPSKTVKKCWAILKPSKIY